MSDFDSPQAISDRYSCRVLEFEAVRDLLREFLSGPISHGAVGDLSPDDNLDAIQLALERVAKRWNSCAEVRALRSACWKIPARF